MFQKLTELEERTLEWIAEKAKQNKISIRFQEATQALNIADNETLAQILEKLQRRFPTYVVQNVLYRGSIAEQKYSFDISVSAARVWYQYKIEKQQNTCPECEKPALQELGPVYRYHCAGCGKEFDRPRPENVVGQVLDVDQKISGLLRRPQPVK